MADAVPAASREAREERRRPMSKGEKLFDFVVYGPVNFFGTFALSAVLAVVQKRKLPFIHEKTEDMLMHIKLPKKMAERLSDVLVTSVGGTAMIVPLKLIEDNKVELVNAHNKRHGDPTPPEAIEAAPKQTWWSLITGRLSTIVLVLGAMTGIGKLFGDHMSDAEKSTGKTMARWMNTETHRDMAKAVPMEAEIERLKTLAKPSEQEAATLKKLTRDLGRMETSPYTFGKMLAVDTFVTVAAVATLYLTSKFFARKADERKHDRHEKTTHEAPAPTREEAQETRAGFAARLAEKEQDNALARGVGA